MPAPIWPMPGSRWAMPVLMTGKIPVSTTLRASMPAGVPAKIHRRNVKALFWPERDVAHHCRVGDRVVGRAADETDDGRRGSHGETAEPGSLGDRAVAEVGCGVGDRVSREIKAVDHRRRSGEPAVARARSAGCRNRRRCAPSR